MAKLTFYGATGTVTGSRFHLEIDGKNILIDCGMFQGKKEIRLKNWGVFPIPPATFDYVFLTHAHIDHSGYLPKFVREGFNGKIICTHATAELCKVMLKDSAHIQEEDAKWANKKGFPNTHRQYHYTQKKTLKKPLIYFNQYIMVISSNFQKTLVSSFMIPVIS